jgi:hypothetical protein
MGWYFRTTSSFLFSPYKHLFIYLKYAETCTNSYNTNVKILWYRIKVHDNYCNMDNDCKTQSHPFSSLFLKQNLSVRIIKHQDSKLRWAFRGHWFLLAVLWTNYIFFGRKSLNFECFLKHLIILCTQPSYSHSLPRCSRVIFSTKHRLIRKLSLFIIIP